MEDLKNTIEEAFERRADITPRNVETHISDAVNEAIALLDSGEARVAEKKDGSWVVNEWLKKAVLLSFRINDNEFIKGGFAAANGSCSPTTVSRANYLISKLIPSRKQTYSPHTQRSPKN